MSTRMPNSEKSMEKIVALCKKRGFCIHCTSTPYRIAVNFTTKARALPFALYLNNIVVAHKHYITGSIFTLNFVKPTVVAKY